MLKRIHKCRLRALDYHDYPDLCLMSSLMSGGQFSKSVFTGEY